MIAPIIKLVMRKLGLRAVLARIGLLPERTGTPLIRMRFPSFDPQVNASLEGDYFRNATLGLALHRIDATGVPGALAEVGVYKGAMSAFIHSQLPERPVYLFDTFSGFPERDLDQGIIDRRFSDADAEGVLARLGGAETVHLVKGRVPDTFTQVPDVWFAFVLLDLDLFEPMKTSLEFFYPRLNQGGYLVVHDYNNSESNWACKRAFDAFLTDKPECLVEIADEWGTALIRKTKTT